MAIKVVRSDRLADPRARQMFLDEARLAATVRHPNVVEILDIGQDAEGFFIVMEYLSGESLAFVAQTLSRRKQLAPPQMILRLGAAVAAGLHCAHTAVDASGKPQPVVHRAGGMMMAQS